MQNNCSTYSTWILVYFPSSLSSKLAYRGYEWCHGRRWWWRTWCGWRWCKRKRLDHPKYQTSHECFLEQCKALPFSCYKSWCSAWKVKPRLPCQRTKWRNDTLESSRVQDSSFVVRRREWLRQHPWGEAFQCQHKRSHRNLGFGLFWSLRFSSFWWRAGMKGQ